MPRLTRSQTKTMDRKEGESLLAYEECLAAVIQEANDRAGAAAKERGRIEQEEEAKRQKEEQDRLRQEEADLQATAEHRSRQREAAHWVQVASADEAPETEKGLSALAQVSHDLVATCVLQQEEILHLQQTVDQMLARLQALEKQPAAVAAAGPSNLATRVQVLEDDVSNIKRVHQDFRTSQQATNLQLETQVQAAATVTPAATSSRRPPKLDDIPVFCDQSKTEPIPWWRQFTLRLDMHHELTDAWHKRFQVEPPDLQAMDKLNKLHQNTLLSQDWITEFQRLASTPDLPLAFRAIKHLFIMRSCPALQNALTQIAETLDTFDKLFSTASRIILTNIEALDADRSSATTSGTQPKPKVACITSTEAATPNEGEVLAAARDGWPAAQQPRPRQDEDSVHLYTEHRISGRRTLGTIRTLDEFLSHATQVPLLPLVQQHHPRCCTLPHQGETPSGKVGAAEGDSTPPSTTSEAVVATTALSSEAYADVGSLPLSFEDFAARLVPSLDASQEQDTCASFSPSEDEVAVGDMLGYVAKVAREFVSQRGSIGPTFSRTPPAIVSRAKSVGIASHATIVRSASYTHYQCPLGDGKQLLWISPAPFRSTRPALMGSSRSSTASPSTPCFCLAAITQPISSPLDATLPRTAESDDHLAFFRRMQELLVKARDQMSKTQIRMSCQANRNRLPCPFCAGDLVWVSAAEFSLEQDISRKLLPKWMGPWRILSAVGDDLEGPSFRIAVPPHLPVHTVFHCSELAPFVSTESNEFHGRRTQDPPSMDGFQEAGYIITDRCHGNKETKFLLHFSYCSHKADHWLTRSELQATAPAVLSRYLSKGKTTPSTSAPRLPRYIPPSDRQLRLRPGSSS
ncbi:hypothetical protein CBR_g52461 [Chara braunii]|uniref:Tf2-1-like SH3-like domain-containing protein n=1 Tax=Chara braunii TaxID=69332 RepID=A0A388MAG5_CHABU|nr:hypothetical protein CBR_g52461 [Chara braunii]|eukprot:GBG91505.1 hypothetical protein CBR_g52461 [Chara braunii]